MKMRLTKVNIILISIICICILTLSLGVMVDSTAYAEGMSDGKYTVSFDTDLTKMGMMAFENSAKELVVEKVGSTYYMTASFDAGVVKDIKLISDNGLVGETIKRDGMIERHTYTMSEASINAPVSFSLYIVQMKSDKSFSITPNLSTATRLGDVDDIGERPAEYVPVIDVNATDDELETGSIYSVAPATAKLGNSDIAVNVRAYYTSEGINKDIDIVDGKIKLENVGEYHIVYRAESDKYVTSLGNNTFTEIDIKIVSKIGAMSLARIEAPEDILPANIQIQAGFVTKGEEYDAIKAKMDKESEHYEIMNVRLLNSDGRVVNPSGEISLYLLANEAYNRNDIVVYRVANDGSLLKCEVAPYGRYVRVTTDEVGTFVVSVPGIAFHMPMWGYAVIIVVSVLIIVAIVVAIVVVSRRKKKINQLAIGNIENDIDDATENVDKTDENGKDSIN